MKIALVSRGFSSHKGGAERFTSSFCQKMASLGHEIHLLCGEPQGTEMPGIKYKEIKYSKKISFLKILSFHFAVKSELKKESYDLVYGLCQFFPLDYYYAGGGVHRHWMKLRYPLFLFRLLKYLFSPVHLAMVWLEKLICNPRNKAHVITNSILVKNHIIEYFKYPSDRIHVIYDGVDSGIFNPAVKQKFRKLWRIKYGLSDEEVLLGFASNNWPRKGLDTILKVLSRLPVNYKLAIAGRGNEKAYLSKALKSGITSDRILFMGIMESIEPFYGMIDVFVLPTMYDPFAQVCREAMACGIPVVTTASNGAAELINNYNNGFIMSRWNSAEELYNFFTRKENDLLLMGKQAFQTVKDASWDQNIKDHIKVFELQVR